MVATANKSEMIREMLQANPGAMPSQIVEQMKAKGVKVTNSLASVVKTKMNHERNGTTTAHKKTPRRAIRKTKRPPKGQGDHARANEYYRTHPGASAQEIMEATGVKPQAAYNARSYAKMHQHKMAEQRKRRKAAKAQRGMWRKPKRNGGGAFLNGEMTALHAAAALLASCHGDVDHATQALDAVHQIRDTVAGAHD